MRIDSRLLLHSRWIFYSSLLQESERRAQKWLREWRISLKATRRRKQPSGAVGFCALLSASNFGHLAWLKGCLQNVCSAGWRLAIFWMHVRSAAQNTGAEWEGKIYGDESGHLAMQERAYVEIILSFFILVPDTISINVGCSVPCAVNKHRATASTQWDVAACNDVD